MSLSSVNNRCVSKFRVLLSSCNSKPFHIFFVTRVFSFSFGCTTSVNCYKSNFITGHLICRSYYLYQITTVRNIYTFVQRFDNLPFLFRFTQIIKIICVFHQRLKSGNIGKTSINKYLLIWDNSLTTKFFLFLLLLIGYVRCLTLYHIYKGNHCVY